jgi:serine O-acetyltransferase
LIVRLREDLDAVLHRDPAARNRLEVVLTYPGLRALWWHRVEHALWERGFCLVARMSSARTRRLTGVEIHPAAVLGRRVVIDHGMGVVIGETAVVGDDVMMFHGVTLGGRGRLAGIRHPQVGNDVLLGAGATVLGSVRIGDGARIGAGSLVVRDVPAGAVVLAPAAIREDEL